jgi:hypothetical protein
LSTHRGHEGAGAQGPAAGAAGAGSREPTEEELRAAYEAELSRITTTDMMAQAAVSLLNIGARRLAPPGGEGAGERDLEQARDAIDGARALLEILERRIPQELGPLRDALSRLQMAYAREIPPGGAGAGEERGEGDAAEAPQRPGEQRAPQEGDQSPGPGPAESSGRLWVPGR